MHMLQDYLHHTIDSMKLMAHHFSADKPLLSLHMSTFMGTTHRNHHRIHHRNHYLLRESTLEKTIILSRAIEHAVYDSLNCRGDHDGGLCKSYC